MVSILFLLHMTGFACQRSAGIAGSFFLFVALDALQVHDFFGFDGPLGFHLFYGVLFLGEDAVADIAVLDPFLVLGMREWGFSGLAAKDIDVGRPVVGGPGDNAQTGQYKYGQGNGYDTAIHATLRV
jgi:hypothetical protein